MQIMKLAAEEDIDRDASVDTPSVESDAINIVGEWQPHGRTSAPDVRLIDHEKSLSTGERQVHAFEQSRYD